MRIFSLSILFFVITHPLLSQVTFEKGYFINNNNDTVKCLIKNYEWKNNPFEFTFKENESSQPQLAPVYNVRFFEIYGKSKYIRSEVNIDRSDSKLNTLSKSSSPEWSYEMLFLKVIIDSDYSLYSYHQNNFTRFFYSTPDIPITQLVYKKYELSGVVAFNNRFRQQLWIDIRCPEMNATMLENLRYKQKDLEKYFHTFFNCLGGSSAITTKQKPGKKINFKLTSGVNLSSLTLSRVAGLPTTNPKYVNLGYTLTPRFGFETEFILPYNNNKWSILLEPTFQSYSGKTNEINNETEANLLSIEFPIGLRYYVYLNDSFSLYFNALYTTNYSLNFNSVITHTYLTMDINPSGNYALGTGLSYKQFSLETRYNTNRNVLAGYSYWSGNYDRLSFILGYKLNK